MPAMPGIAVGGVADEREVVGDQRRVDAELLAHAGGVADRLGAAIHLHDAIAAHALREVLVRRPDADLLHALVGVGERGRGGECVVGFELDHRPHGHAHRGERFLERMKLRPQRGLDAVAGLVAGPEVVAERLDDVIGRDADVRGAAFDHLEHGVEHAEHGAEGLVLPLVEAAQAVEMTEQLVGAVDEMDDHVWGSAVHPTAGGKILSQRSPRAQRVRDPNCEDVGLKFSFPNPNDLLFLGDLCGLGERLLRSRARG